VDEFENRDRERATGAAAAERLPAGWVLYDAACGVCSRWVPFWAPTLRKYRFETAPLQAAWVKERLGISEAELLQDFRLLLADGRELRGAEAYRHIMRRIPWAFPAYLVVSAPGLRVVFDWAYRRFARNRLVLSRACGLPPAIRKPAC